MKVLELGSGCALAGISYMLRGASVVMTDLAVVVSALTERNAHVDIFCINYLTFDYRMFICK